MRDDNSLKLVVGVLGALRAREAQSPNGFPERG